MKRMGTFTVRLDETVIFDSHRVWIIKFDLAHINHDWNEGIHDYNKKWRSHYTGQDIIDFLSSLIITPLSGKRAKINSG